MAAGKLHFKSDAGGITSVSREAGATNGELVLPVSGTVVSVAGAVNDNAVARYDSTTGKLQNSGVVIDDSNNVWLQGNGDKNLLVQSANGLTSNLTLLSTGVTSWNIANNSGPLIFKMDATERMRIDASGNVGIGVTPSAWGSGIKALDIRGATINSVGAGQNIEIGINYYANDGYKYKANSTASKYHQESGNHYWFTAPSGTAGNPITWTNAMTLTSNTLSLGNGTGDVVAQLNCYGFNSSTNNFEFVQRTANKGFNWYVNSGSINAMTLDSSGNLILTSGTGALGYGTGAGGTVTQLTSKSTAVTLNKPAGLIVMNNSVLAAGASVEFTLNNSLISGSDFVIYGGDLFSYNYRIEIRSVGYGSCVCRITNITTSSLSEALIFNVAVIKGATA